MQCEDKGYLLSKSRYNENSIIAEIFTKNHGKISGIVFGASSKKLKNYLQIGNKFHINFNSKNDSQSGYFKVEIDKVVTPIYFENKKKLACIISAMSLIKLLTVELQENTNIFKLINNFLLSMTKLGFIPTLFATIVFAIIFPFLSTMLDLNSDSIKFLFVIFFFNELRKIALVEKINDTITKTKKIKAILLKDIFRLVFFV